MQKVRVIRDRHTNFGTFGMIRTPSGKVYYTIERNWKNNAEMTSCFPVGDYVVKWMPSPRFGWAYRLQNVPKRVGILIHPANYAMELQGCMALGMSRNSKMISSSRLAQSNFEREMGYTKPFLLQVRWSTELLDLFGGKNV